MWKSRKLVFTTDFLRHLIKHPFQTPLTSSQWNRKYINANLFPDFTTHSCSIQCSMWSIPFSVWVNKCHMQNLWQFTKLTWTVLKCSIVRSVFQLTCTTPSSQPRITSCLPILNLKGLSLSRDESNLRPSVREPAEKEMETDTVRKKDANAQPHVGERSSHYFWTCTTLKDSLECLLKTINCMSKTTWARQLSVMSRL